MQIRFIYYSNLKLKQQTCYFAFWHLKIDPKDTTNDSKIVKQTCALVENLDKEKNAAKHEIAKILFVFIINVTKELAKVYVT